MFFTSYIVLKTSAKLKLRPTKIVKGWKKQKKQFNDFDQYLSKYWSEYLSEYLNKYLRECLSEYLSKMIKNKRFIFEVLAMVHLKLEQQQLKVKINVYSCKILKSLNVPYNIFLRISNKSNLVRQRALTFNFKIF